MFRSSTISLVLILATGAGQIEGKGNCEENESPQRLHVRIYDYAQVFPEILIEAKRSASWIFRRAGVEVSWSDHSFDGNSGESSLNSEAGCPVLQLRILNQQMVERLPMVSKHMTGLTFQGTGGQRGRVANIFYHRVQELAQSKICSKGQILGHAAAHELGHLLLGSIDHSSTGLMQARLGHKDLQAAARGLLVFTEEQVVLIRRAFSSK